MKAMLTLVCCASVLVSCGAAGAWPGFAESFDSCEAWTNETDGAYYCSDGLLTWVARRDVNQRFYMPGTAYSGPFHYSFDFLIEASTGNGQLHVGFTSSTSRGTNPWLPGLITYVSSYSGYYSATIVAEDAANHAFSPWDGDAGTGCVILQANTWYSADMDYDGTTATLDISLVSGGAVGSVQAELPWSLPPVQYAYIGEPNSNDSPSISGQLDNFVGVQLVATERSTWGAVKSLYQ